MADEMIDRTVQPEVKPLKGLASIAPQKYTFANGVPVCVLHSAEQEVVRLDVVFKGGRWRQSRKLQSLFTNRMLREGTVSYTSPQIAEILDYYGAWLELSTSADSEYITLYSLCKYFDRTLDLVESMIKEPLFPEREFGIIAANNRQQWIVNSAKMDFISRRSIMKQMYGVNHPCGNLVQESDYNTLTTDDLRAFHTAHYNSAGCAVFISGRVSDDIMRRLERSFGAESFGSSMAPQPMPAFTIETSPKKRLFVERPEAMQSSLKMASFTIGRTHDDYLKLRVLLELFGGYFGCRLMTNIREEKGYTYGISASLVHQPDSSMLMVDTETDKMYVESVIKEIGFEMDRLCTERVSAEELTIVKNYMTGEMCRNYDSPFSLADLWIYLYVSGLPDDYFDRSVAAIEETTPEDILTLSQRYLRKEDMLTVIAGAR